MTAAPWGMLSTARMAKDRFPPAMKHARNAAACAVFSLNTCRQLYTIQRSPEDIVATIIGVSEAKSLCSAAFQGAAPSSSGSPVP